MKNALLVHGWDSKESYYNPERPTNSNANWFPWLTKQLMVRDIHTVSIEMPRSFDPNYDAWKKELERYDVTSSTLLVGHSCGAGFLVRWLSENDKRVGRVVLVAPWLGDDPDREFDSTFFDFELDKEFASRTAGTIVIHSNDDTAQVTKGFEKLKNLPNIKLKVFEDKGHFCLDDLKTDEFPELLEEILL